MFVIGLLGYWDIMKKKKTNMQQIMIKDCRIINKPIKNYSKILKRCEKNVKSFPQIKSNSKWTRQLKIETKCGQPWVQSQFRVNRNSLHLFLPSHFFLQLSGSSGGGLTSCVIFVTLLHYFTLTNFFWMLVEGTWTIITQPQVRLKLAINSRPHVFPSFLIASALVHGVVSKVRFNSLRLCQS